MDTEPAEVNDQKTPANDEDGPRVVDPVAEAPMRTYIKTRTAIHMADEEAADMSDEFIGELMTEFAYAIKIVLNREDENGKKKYKNLLCLNEMKISNEMQDWVPA